MASQLPLTIALAILLLGGWFLLGRADTQARDTIRKHHLEDLEQALYFARNLHGTYPPYDQLSWCGILSSPGSQDVRAPVEVALRAQNEKYANPDKPFPTDPKGDQSPDYFYWKRNPATFELYSILETDPTAERGTAGCGQNLIYYDYGLTSLWRKDH